MSKLLLFAIDSTARIVVDVSGTSFQGVIASNHFGIADEEEIETS